MKKFLLSLATVAIAASASATSYTIFDVDNRGDWKANGVNYECTVVAGGKTFELKYNKAGYNNGALKSPADNASWRVYKNSEIVISSPDLDLKQIIITYSDEKNQDGKGFAGELELSSGWTGSLAGLEYTLVSSGLKTITMSPKAFQVRIVNIVVSDEVGDIEPPVKPDLPDGVIANYPFGSASDYGEWTVTTESNADAAGWVFDNQYSCVKCTSYWKSENHQVKSTIEKEFNLAGYEDCKFTFKQCFLYYYPTVQEDYTRVYVKTASGNVNYLVMSHFPTRIDGKNYTSWGEEEFDISEYDGEKVTIGFLYDNPGKDMTGTWEVNSFVLNGKKVGAVEGIAADNAPAVYYNLQGVRVNAPENGLFIVVKGGKSTKVIL